MLTSVFALTFVPSVAHAQGVGTRAPAFRLADGIGQPLTLVDVLGEPLVLNVWATWCPPCREELPLFEQTQAALAEDVTFLLVNNNESADAAAQFLAQEGISLLAAFEPTRAQRNQFDLDTTRDVVRDYRVRGMPTTFFIDADGVIQAVKVGAVSRSELSELLVTIGVDWQQDASQDHAPEISDPTSDPTSDLPSDLPRDLASNLVSDLVPETTVLGEQHGRISSLERQSTCGDACPTSELPNQQIDLQTNDQATDDDPSREDKR